VAAAAAFGIEPRSPGGRATRKARTECNVKKPNSNCVQTTIITAAATATTTTTTPALVICIVGR